MGLETIKPGYEKIVNDFDKWLSENIISLMDLNTTDAILTIRNKWVTLKHEYITELLKEYDLIKEYHIIKKGVNK